MNKMMLGKPFLMVAVVGAAVVGCSTSDGSNGSPSTGTQEMPLSIAERFVALNTQADSDMNLVARKYLNNGTEVAMFHEPIAGHIMFSVAGSPLGSSVLRRDLIEGKTASELWALVAPGEPVSDTLAQAIERSKNPAPLSEALIVEKARPSGPQFGALAPAVQTEGETLLSGGYCVSQFWADWGNIGNGAQNRTSSVFNFGWYDIAYNGVTHQSQYAACPLGNVSNLGGRLTVHFPNGSTSQWNLGPDFFLVTGVWTAGTNCGWDISCGRCPTPPFCQIGGTRCTPQGFNIEGRFDSQCFLSYGSSCGDNFDWISWASFQGPYCQ
jgi:hypothetical protein